MPGCSQCVAMENGGEVSRRTGINSYYGTDPVVLSGPRGLEINIDYTCNLACIVCGPELSTKWRLELANPAIKQLPVRLDNDQIVQILDQMDLSNLDNIHFYGGEPFLTPTHEVILEYIDKKVGLDKIYVWYNTNGTVKVKQKIFDLWARCKMVRIYFSIDDVGARFEYIRYPASWSETEDTMFWFRENSPVNVLLAVQPTINCVNAYYHQDIMRWINDKFDTNRVGDKNLVTRHPASGTFQLSAMPRELIDLCIARNQQDAWMSKFLESVVPNEDHTALARSHLKTFDHRRSLDFAKIFPDLGIYFT